MIPSDPAASPSADRASLPVIVALRDAPATEAAGARLARVLRPGMVVTLAGDLGSGKTTLVRGLLRALGWTGPVKSPTYTLVEHYKFSSLYFYHFDFYRLLDPAEWSSGGFDEYFRPDAVCVIEWPERVASELPAVDLAVRLEYAGDDSALGRVMTLRAGTEAGRRCLTEMNSAAGASASRWGAAGRSSG